MSGRLLNVSLQQPTAASSDPAADSESPPSAPSEARRPLKPPVPGLVRSFAWGSMLVDPGCLARRWTPPSPLPVCERTQMPVSDARFKQGGVGAVYRGCFSDCDRCLGPLPGTEAPAAAWTTDRAALTSRWPTGGGNVNASRTTRK